MEKTHIIKYDEEEEKTLCGIRCWTIPFGSLYEELLTEEHIREQDIERIICKSCLRNWRKCKNGGQGV